MKIGLVTYSYKDVSTKNSGGLENFIFLLGRELDSRGHRVTLLGTKESKVPFNLVPIGSSLKLISEDINVQSPDFIRRLLVREIFALERVFENSREFDVLHFNLIDWFLPFITLENTLWRKSVITAHTTFLLPEETELVFSKDGPMMVYISESFSKRFALNPKSAIVKNGIDLPDKKYLRLEKEDYFISLGRIVPSKGVKEAIALAKKNNRNLFVVGDIDNRHYFEQELKPMFDNKIKYIGSVFEGKKFELLAKAKAFLFPLQWEEPFGLVMVEAMACGTPVIAYRRGAVAEIVKDGITGFVCPPDDEQCMIKAIKNIDKIDRRACRRHVEENFTVEKMVDGYEKVYQKVLSQKH